MMNALFEAYPGLCGRIPYIALGDFPTPVQRLERLEEALAGNDSPPTLYVKRDDLSGKPYGGNKVRKLEFLLGRALEDGRKTLMTFGGAGSNHALATAIYAKQVGLQSISMLVPQPNAHSVRRNLLMSLRVGAELHQRGGMASLVPASLLQLLRHALKEGKRPQVIPPGGTSPTGMIGFVSAGLELKRQIEAGELPAPDCVYAASGTMGTVVGLLLGLKAAGLATRVVAVRVTDPKFTSMRKARRLFDATANLLHAADPDFPVIPFPEADFELRHDYYGTQYALYTQEGIEAVNRMRETDGVKLEGTYTGKTLAALLGDLEAGRLRGQTVLFWDTFNSQDFRNEIEGMDYHRLPRAFHRYFEEEVQSLDRP